MTPRLRIVVRVNSFYVRNAWNDEIVAGPFSYEANARRTVVAMDGSRFECRPIDTDQHGVWDKHEHRFIGCALDESVTYTTGDSALAKRVARTLNDKQRNEARLRQYQERYPVSGDFS